MDVGRDQRLWRRRGPRAPGAPCAQRQRHFVGGLSALLLQSPHPEAIVAVSAHPGSGATSGGQLQRTSTFLTTTMRGTADSAWSARERVRAGHVRNHGVTDEGVPYRLTPPLRSPSTS
ncbi:oxygenase MpaB family protein [Streptomyces sp. NPDC052071]|uniref:oxygenase MpaB family protein n=1 Tax=Streptomyces TaxID=1883 RepID=UPI00106EE3D4|nr:MULTISPECIES: oxygenase MpaB family protein [unclassified Streptomyces]MDF6066682.1 DUF2236 domain-containing protein [Streptomyces sp. JH010]QBR10239.1 DUF2236 domain-containing protein [Streptomyces sp. S501]WJY35349.1 oxygenase MpaB family protein [Streptomyces sp. P9-2B-1]